ncbi:MAG: ribosomal protein S18-alanine N-acetyltransferase [Clostridia bacterium]
MVDYDSREKRPKPLRDITLRPMEAGDIPHVLEIERRSYPTPWSETAFRSEITHNTSADYVVATHCEKVIGYAGMWLFLFEAHVTNIAVHPDYRGRKVGAQLLLGLMGRALLRGLKRMTLEVRVSNALAQDFYESYGFQFVKLKKGYYTDTGEDALVMLCRDIGEVLEKKGWDG